MRITVEPSRFDGLPLVTNGRNAPLAKGLCSRASAAFNYSWISEDRQTCELHTTKGHLGALAKWQKMRK
jgi:hypothetical protein